MRLTEFSVSGYQSYREEQVVGIEQDVTLLAGRNNVGKSALLRALQLLRDGQSAIADDGVVLSYAWRAGSDELLAELPDAAGWEAIRSWLGSVAEHELRVRFVSATPHGTRAFYCVRLELPALDAVAEGAVGRTMGWTRNGIANAATATSELVALAMTAAQRTVSILPRRVEQGRRNLTRQAQLMPDGRNLGDVLLHLQLNRATTTYRELVEFMQIAFPDIDSLTVATQDDQPGATLVGEPHVHFRGRTESVPLQYCGTGVEQLLALAIAVLGADGPHLFLIDEPQAYLHPHAERSLLTLLERHPEHQYVIATHSHLLLRSRALSQTRLLTLVDGATRVAGVADGDDLLDELGVTAADLWLADRILWVEGPTEQEVFAVLAADALDPAQRLTFAVKRMPEAASRFSAGRRQARGAYAFCADITAAIAPLQIEMRFLFDRDETRHEDREGIAEASRGTALFLSVREIENFFLEPSLIHMLLTERCRAHDLPVPELETVAQRLEEVLADVENRKVFPAGASTEGEARILARGSQVLDALSWEFTTTPYRKVEDGRRLAELALEHAPDVLEELRSVLHDLAGGAEPSQVA